MGRARPLPREQLCIGQLGAPPDSRAPIGRERPTPGEGSEAESGIGGPAVPSRGPCAPPAAASPLWRRPCSPPRRGRPPGSPAAAAAACAAASTFPPASGRAPPPPGIPLRCGKGLSCARRGTGVTAANGRRPNPSRRPRPPGLRARAAEGRVKARPSRLRIVKYVRLRLRARAGSPSPG